MGNCFTLVYVLNQAMGTIDKKPDEYALFLDESNMFLDDFLGKVEIEAPDYLVNRILERTGNS